MKYISINQGVKFNAKNRDTIFGASGKYEFHNS